jgi:hypothetical protein
LLREAVSAQPLPADVTVTAGALGGVPTAVITVDGSDITPGVPHVFQAYHAILDEAVRGLDRAGQLLLTHLAGAERVAAERKAERQLVR